MERIKENVLNDYIAMIKQSWTYAKMTKEEQKQLQEVFYSVRLENALKGTYKQRWDVLQAVYFGFLSGLGYAGGLWRETAEDVPSF